MLNKMLTAPASAASFGRREAIRAPMEEEEEGTRSEASRLGNEVAELKKKRQDLLRILSPSYDVRKQLGETSEDAVIANKVTKEYYSYFRDALYGATRSMGAGPEKEMFRRQTCHLFQTIYDDCRKEILRVLTNELAEAMKEVEETDSLSERQFDRQRAFGLLFLNLSRHDLPVEERLATSNDHNMPATATRRQCWTPTEQPAENEGLQSEKFKLQQEINELEKKQVELLRMYRGTISLERVKEWVLVKGENEVLTGMKDELGKLTTLPEEVSRSGTMTGMNEKEFYTRQQAYGLLLSACNPHLNSDSVQQIISVALNKLELTAKPIFQSQAEQAVPLAWRILTCVPPLVVCQPIKYTEDWHQPMAAHWTTLRGPFDLVYYQPLLLSSTSGPVKEKGQVGRVESKDPESCVNIEEEQDSSSEQEDGIDHQEELSARQMSAEQSGHPTPLPDKVIKNSSSNVAAVNTGSFCCSLV